MFRVKKLLAILMLLNLALALCGEVYVKGYFSGYIAERSQIKGNSCFWSNVVSQTLVWHSCVNYA